MGKSGLFVPKQITHYSLRGGRIMYAFKSGKSFFSLSLSVIPSLKMKLGSSLPTVFMVVEVMVFWGEENHW